MIIVRLTGGLGNEMFQYAAGRAASLRAKTPLKFDVSSYANDKFGRHYSLDVFNIKATMATPQEIRRLSPTENFLTQKSPRLLRLLSNLAPSYVNEVFRAGLIPLSRNQLYLDGYWQNEKYFLDYADQIRQDFRLKPHPNKKVIGYLKKILSCDSVAIHIRRGDYVSNTQVNKSVGVCGEKYYQRAMKFVAKIVRKPFFFIFSEPDGLKWAKESLKFDFPFVLVESDKDYEDLRMMSSCRHNIVANSSFSWWGAWLNTNYNHIIIAPEPWLAKTSKSSLTIVPHRWVKLPKS